MNKFILALLAGTFLASNAMADCNGFYLGGRGGIVKHDYSKKGNSGINSDGLDKNRLMLSGALGYRYNYVRAELEYVWRDKSQKSYGDDASGDQYDPSFQGKRTFKTQSYMLNGYFDFAPYRWFTPYVSAGIGLTEMNYKDNYSSNSGGSSTKTNNGNYKPTRFTWSVGGGLTVKVTNRFNVDAGYRYYDMGSIKHADITAHEIYSGLRYVF